MHTLDQAAPGAHTSADRRPQSRDRRAIARTLARRGAPIRGLREAKTQMTMEANDMTTNSGPRAVSVGEAHLGGQRLERLRRTAGATDPKAATRRRQRAKPLNQTLRAAALLLVALSAIGAHPTVVKAQTEVPANWSLIPTGLGPGDSFRLMFIPSTGITAVGSSITTYDNHVQSAAAAGHTDIQAYSSAFKMLGSTRVTDARDHTGTTGVGVPIYWLNGAKIADNYADFYDGTWDEEAQGRRESGVVVNLSSTWQIWTGSTHQGTELIGAGNNSRALGPSSPNNLVGVGKPNSTTSGHGPLAGETADKNGSKAVYALSDVLIVASNPTWSLTLTDPSGNAVTELTEGGAGATATISITNNVRFNTAQSVTLKWGGNDISSGPIVGAGGRATITIAAGSASASLHISAPQEIHPRYQPATTLALSAEFMGTATGASLNLTFISNDPAPSAKISSAPNAVVEGGSVEFRIGLSHPATVPIEVKFGVTDPDGALSGTPPTSVQVPALQTEATVTLTAEDNSVQNDGTREVTLALALDADEPYTLGTPSRITVQVLDNDATGDNTPPVVVTAQALTGAHLELKFSETPVITFDAQNSGSSNFVGGSKTSPVFTITSGGRTFNAHIIAWNTERMLINPIGDESMLSTDIISLAYTKPAINPIADAAGNEMLSFTGVFVRNSIPRRAPQAPENLRIRATGDGAMTLAWDAAWHNGTPISAYQVRHARGMTPSGTWTTVPGGGSARSYEFTNLTVGASYTFEVHAVNLGGAGTSRSIDGIPVRPGVHVDTTSIFEGESARLHIVPQGAPFGALKTVTVVLASHSGPDQAKAGSDFRLIENAMTPPSQDRPFNQGGFSGLHPHLHVHLSPAVTDLTADIVASDDDVSECRESVTAFAYLDYGTSNQMQIGTGQRIAIFDNDNRPDEGQPEPNQRPTVQSATVDGRTVTLTFSEALSEVNPADDPYLEEGDVAPTPQMFFTLFEAKSAGVGPPPDDPGTVTGDHYKVTYGTGARTFALDGDTVTLTFPHRIDTTYGAWVRYDQSSRYSPLGITPSVPKAGQCVAYYGVADFTQAFAAGANTAGDDPLPVITVNDREVREGTGPMVFTVTMSERSDETVSVDFRTIARTAKAAMRDTGGNVIGDFWPVAGTLLFAPGQTTKTVPVQIVDDSVEDDGETFLLDLSDVSGATMDERTSYGTGTIRNSEDAPTGNEHTLTATFANVPAEHGGGGEANRFSFDLTFSENPEVSYRTLRDHAFTITGGDVKKAKRKVQGSNQSWTITVEPDGWGDVRITLPGNRACSASNAVCMPDGRQLSNSPSATISGPAALSIADATANENSDSGLNFVVSLDRVSTLTVTVDYATSDGTATAGHDYTATSGTLTFNPGDAAKAINVPLLDDAVDDGGETITVTLSNASNARIADGTATGTIENSDPLQQAWIARFGRTVASDVVDGITDRLSTARSGSEVRIAGVTLERNGATWTEAPAEESEITDALEHERALKGRDVSPDELLLNSSFHLQGESDGPGGTAWAAWGRFSQSSFEGEADGVTLSGDVTTGLLGADVGTEEWTAGVALSSAKGDGPFQLGQDDDGNGTSRCDSGTVESALTSVHPYAQVSLSDDVDAWAIGGYGTGDMTIEEEGCSTYKTDIDMTMAAVGLRGQVLAASAGDALDMAVRTDALWLRTSSDKTEGLEAAKASVTRVRLMVEAGRSFSAGTGTLTPTIEAGIRHDAGDAEEGVGFEVGGGLVYQGDGVTIEGKVRTLVAHDDDAYEEWGASAAVRIDPNSDGRGMSLTIAPTWGSAASEAEQLWSTRTAEDLVGNAQFEAESRLDAELGYGIGGPHGLGLLTPYAGLTLADGAQRTMRTGLRWKASQSTTIGLEASREESDGSAANALMLRLSARF